MHISAWETTACRNHNIEKIRHAILWQWSQRSETFRPYKPKNDNDKAVYLIKLIDPVPSDIPQFTHPVVMDLGFDPKRPDIKDCVILDTRNFTRMSQTGDVIVSSALDYDTLMLRGLLQYLWVRLSPMDFLGLGDIHITIYARWVSEAITRRLALPPDVQMRVTVLATYFYIRQFYKVLEADGQIDEEEHSKIAGIISRCTSINVDDVLNVTSSLGHGEDIHWFARQLAEKGNSPRLEHFNPGLLVELTSGSWFGFDFREICAVALEHPPTFMALLAQAANERGYHNTVISKLAKQYDRKDNLKNFLFNLANLPTSF